MNKNAIVFKIFSVVLVLALLNLNLECSLADSISSSRLQEKDKIAVQAIFQQQMMDELGAKFQASGFAEINRMCSVLTIGRYLLDYPKESGNVQTKNRENRLGYLKSVMNKVLDKTAEGITLGQVVFKNLDENNPENKIVLIPCDVGGEECILQIALKREVDENELIGYEWDISDDYVIKIVSKKDTEGVQTFPETIPQDKTVPEEGVETVDADRLSMVKELDLSAAKVPVFEGDKKIAPKMVKEKVTVRALKVLLQQKIIRFAIIILAAISFSTMPISRAFEFPVTSILASEYKQDIVNLNFKVKTGEEVSTFKRGNYSGHILEIKFKKGKSAQIQPWFKNSNWQNLYSFPKWPKDGIVQFDPANEKCNVADFNDLSDIAEIGFKVWSGGTPKEVLGMIESVRLIPAGMKQSKAPEEKMPVSVQAKVSKKTAKIRRTASVVSQALVEGTIEVPLEYGWKAQTLSDSQAVKKVYYDQNEGALVGTVDLAERDPSDIQKSHSNLSKGEVLVDVQNIGMEEFNFKDYTIQAEIRIVAEEGTFGGTSNRPDGVGLFVKTGPAQGWTNMYDWENIDPSVMKKMKKGEYKTVSFSFDERRKKDLVYVQSGFPVDNPMIRMFGLKIAGGAGTDSKFKGKLYVKNFKITPNSQLDKVTAPTYWPETPKETKGQGIIQIPADSGWVGRDQKGNRAVQEVFVSPDKKTVALKVKFKGGDPFGEFNKGSAYCLLYDRQGNRLADIPGLPEKGFVDWSGKVIRAKIWVPQSFTQGKNIPSAVLIGSHDATDNYQNGSWQEGLMTSRRAKKWDDSIRYYPTDPKHGNPGYTTAGYNPGKGKEILVKVGLPGATTPDYEWEGFIYMSDIRIESDDRNFEDPLPELIWTNPKRAVPIEKAPVSPKVFRKWSGGSGYGIFDKDLTKAGQDALADKFEKMGKEAKFWREMALFGSLPSDGPLAFDSNDMFIGYADPETGQMGSTPTEMLPKVLEGVRGHLATARKYGKKLSIVFVAHDAIDGISEKEGREEGDRPSLFTSERKFKAFLDGLKPIIELLCTEGRDVVDVLELLNEPLNADTNKVPIPFMQRRIHEFNALVYKIDPTMYVSTGMRDTASWQYFAFMAFPEAKVGNKTIKIPYYKQIIPQSHWYADKEQDTPLATNIGTFIVPDYIVGWLKGEIDPRTPEEYKAAIGVLEAMKRVYESGYMGALFWMDRPGEFWPLWVEFKDFFERDLPQRAPFASPQIMEEINKSAYWEEKESQIGAAVAILEGFENFKYTYRPGEGSVEDGKMNDLDKKVQMLLGGVEGLKKRKEASDRGQVTEKGTRAGVNAWLADARSVTEEMETFKSEIYASTKATKEVIGTDINEILPKRPYDYVEPYIAKVKEFGSNVIASKTAKTGGYMFAGIFGLPAIAHAAGSVLNEAYSIPLLVGVITAVITVYIRQRNRRYKRKMERREEPIEKDIVRTEKIPIAEREMSELAVKEEVPLTIQKRHSKEEVRELFDIVEGQINDRRTHLITEGNKIIVFLRGSETLPEELNIKTLKLLDENKNTAEIVAQLIELVDLLEKIVSDDTIKSTGFVLSEEVQSAWSEITDDKRDIEKYQNILQIEMDSIVANMIICARYFKKTRDDKPFIIGIETDWIPGVYERSSQREVMGPMLGGLNDYETILKNLGLDKVLVIHKERTETRDAWINRIFEKGDLDGEDYSNVLMLGSEKTINHFERTLSGDIPANRKAFLASVKADLIEKYYKESKEDLETKMQVIDVQIMQMLSISLELRNGRVFLSNAFIDKYFNEFEYDISGKWVSYEPKALRVDYENLRVINRLRKKLVDAAA